MENQELFEDLGGLLLRTTGSQVDNGFRGQVTSFWHHDSRFVTAKSRLQLISQVIQRQCEIVRNIWLPDLCTNL